MGFRIETQEPLTRRETKVEMNTQHLGQLNQVQQSGVRTIQRVGGRRDRGWDAAERLRLCGWGRWNGLCERSQVDHLTPRMLFSD